MDYETAQELAFDLKRNWNVWSDLKRGDAVDASYVRLNPESVLTILRVTFLA